jgi:trans-aconitate 2-methyltransferase
VRVGGRHRRIVPYASTLVTSSWDPQQYNRFADEREQPFWDLASLLTAVPSPSVVDLGCGDGRLTAALHAHLGARTTLGVDASDAMLGVARAHATGEIRFESGDLATWHGKGVDIVFANASLQWVPDHEHVLGRWRDSLAPGGQLAVQMPANADHASHRVSRELAQEWLGAAAPGDPVEQNVRRPEEYAELLDALGFAHQRVRLQVYAHHLPATADVAEWVKGTSLTRFKPAFTPEEFERFVEEYRRRLVAELGEHAPYFYAFKRILCCGRLGEGSA